VQLTNQQRYFEISAVIATGAGKFIFMDWLDWRAPFIITSVIFWVGYVFYRSKKYPGLMQHWGFTKVNFWTTFKPLLIAGGISIIGFIAYAYWKGHLSFTWHIIFILLLYPIWGTIQQFLMMSLIGGNLYDNKELNWGKWVVIIVTALAFSLIHLPAPILTIATFFLALVYGWLFLKHRNIWPLGLFHGWLGALFYYFVLNRDPWIEAFGTGAVVG